MIDISDLLARGDSTVNKVGNIMSDPGLLALVSGIGANILKGQNSALAPAASGINQFAQSLAAAKAGTQGMIGQPAPQPAAPTRVAQLPAPSVVPGEPVQVQQDPQVKALINANKALGEAMLAVQPTAQGGSQPQENPPQASTTETPSAAPSGTSSAPAVEASGMQNLVDLVSQGPKQVSNPFVGYVNPDPFTLAGSGSPDAVNALLTTAINAELARQGAQGKSTAEYQQAVEALKAIDAASKTPTEIAKHVAEIGKITDERSGELDRRKKAGELAAVAAETERVALENDNVPIPTYARQAFEGMGKRSMGDLYRVAGTTDPKMIKTFLDGFVSLQNGILNARALTSEQNNFAARLYQEQIENRTRQIAALTAKVAMPAGKDAQNIDLQTLMGMQKGGVLQPQEAEMLAGLIAEREHAQAMLDTVLTGAAQPAKSEAAKRKEKATQGNEIKMDKAKAVPATHPQLPSAAYKQSFGAYDVYFDKSGAILGKTKR